ncbi:MAG: hypothetical protein PVF05_13560 [Gemmatimonadales bacterium]|jgi:hypothetical protein
MNNPPSSFRLPLAALAVAVLAAPLAMPLQAQDLDAACAAIEGSKLGDWTEQTVDSPNGPMDMRFSLVRSRGGTWYEVRAQTSAGASILQMKVPGFPFTPAQIEEVVTKTGSSPAVRLPDAMVRQYTQTAQTGPLGDIRKQCLSAEVLGSENVSVPAGTFRTTHLRFPAGSDVWVSDAVPFGIVRGEIPGQGSMELKAHGTGAESSITGTPMDLGGGASTDSGP